MYDEIFGLFVFKILPLYIALCLGFSLIKFFRLLWVLKIITNPDDREITCNKILYSNVKLNKTLHGALKSLLITLFIISIVGVFLWFLILKGENEFEISSKIAFLPAIIVLQALFALMIVYVMNRYEIKLIKTSGVRTKEFDYKIPLIFNYIRIIIRGVVIGLILILIINYILHILRHQ
jgi:hypothetical protein